MNPKYIAKTTFLWYKTNDQISDDDLINIDEYINKNLVRKIEEPKIEVVTEPKEQEINYDLNGDGKFDSKDKSIAAKILVKRRRRKSIKNKN